MREAFARILLHQNTKEKHFFAKTATHDTIYLSHKLSLYAHHRRGLRHPPHPHHTYLIAHPRPETFYTLYETSLVAPHHVGEHPLLVEIAQDVHQAVLGARFAERHVDGADAQQQRQQLRALEVSVQHLRGVAERVDGDAERRAKSLQAGQVKVEQLVRVVAPQRRVQRADQQQRQVIGGVRVGDHLPVQHGAAQVAVVLFAEQQVAAPEVGVRDQRQRLARRQQRRDHAARARSQR